LDACRDVCAYELALASNWLDSRFDGERNIRIDFRAECRERGWFGRGERMRITTQVSIW